MPTIVWKIPLHSRRTVIILVKSHTLNHNGSVFLLADILLSHLRAFLSQPLPSSLYTRQTPGVSRSCRLYTPWLSFYFVVIKVSILSIFPATPSNRSSRLVSLSSLSLSLANYGFRVFSISSHCPMLFLYLSIFSNACFEFWSIASTSCYSPCFVSLMTIFPLPYETIVFENGTLL